MINGGSGTAVRLARLSTPGKSASGDVKCGMPSVLLSEKLPCKPSMPADATSE